MVGKERLDKGFDGGREIGKSVAEFIEEGIRHLKLDERESYKILLAVDEVIANIIDHAYADKGQKGKVEISLEEKDDNLVIKIHDNGKPFDPEAVKEYKPGEQNENPQSRGRGLYLMKAVMDEVKFEFSPEGNTVTLVKKL